MTTDGSAADPDAASLEAAEDELQRAVSSNDASALATLLHDDLLATGPDGRFVTKAEDVGGYASGAFVVLAYDKLRRQVRVHGGTGVTAVRARMHGQSEEGAFAVVMDYTRTWVREEERWVVLAAHLSLAAQAV